MRATASVFLQTCWKNMEYCKPFLHHLVASWQSCCRLETKRHKHLRCIWPFTWRSTKKIALPEAKQAYDSSLCSCTFCIGSGLLLKLVSVAVPPTSHTGVPYLTIISCPQPHTFFTTRSEKLVLVKITCNEMSQAEVPCNSWWMPRRLRNFLQVWRKLLLCTMRPQDKATMDWDR